LSSPSKIDITSLIASDDFTTKAIYIVPNLLRGGGIL
jgi:hypothetical protein